ncbi:peptidase S41, partial [Rhizobium ruizarguesonis]
MIRRASLVLVGALMGATAMSVIYSAGVPAEAAGSSTYKELSVFGDVFER